MLSYRVQYGSDLVKLSENVTELNRQSTERKATEFKVVAVVHDGQQWAAFLERETAE